MPRLLVILLLCVSLASAQGKKKGGGAQNNQSSGTDSGNANDNSGQGGSGGSPTIESEMVAYEAVSVLSDAIVMKTESAIDGQADAGCKASKNVLLVDPTAQSEIAAFYSFKTSITGLKTAYTNLGPGGAGPAGASPTDWISAGLSILMALRNTAQFSGQTFQPDDTVLATLLAKKFKALGGYTLVSSQLPGDMNGAAAAIVDLIKSVSDARAHVTDPATIQSDYFKALDQQWSALQSSLATTNSSGNNVLTSIVSGQALVTSLGSCYAQLFAKTIAAGGSSRTNHNFFVELFYTTPKPSYNGGAIVSYSVLSGDGKYLTGDTIRYIYDYSKWGPPKLAGYKNF